MTEMQGYAENKLKTLQFGTLKWKEPDKRQLSLFQQGKEQFNPRHSLYRLAEVIP